MDDDSPYLRDYPRLVNMLLKDFNDIDINEILTSDERALIWYCGREISQYPHVSKCTIEEKVACLFNGTCCLNVELVYERINLLSNIVVDKTSNYFKYWRPDLHMMADPLLNSHIPNLEEIMRGSVKKITCLCPKSECDIHPHIFSIVPGDKTRSKTLFGCTFYPCTKNRNFCPCYEGQFDERGLSISNLLKDRNPEIFNQLHQRNNPGIVLDKITFDSHIELTWECSKSICEHKHIWKTTVACRIFSSECPFVGCNKYPSKLCVCNSLASNKELMSEYDFEKNESEGFDKPEITFKKSDEYRWWICKKGPCCLHSWWARIADRTVGKECPFIPCCNYPKQTCPCYSLAANHRLMSEYDFEKNEIEGFDKPEVMLPKSNAERWWICKGPCNCLHSWKASINTRNSGHGCPFKPCCKYPSKICHHYSLKGKFPELMSEYNYDKNIDPTQIFLYSSKYLWWICSVCKYEWSCMVSNRTSGKTGCPRCCRSKMEKETFNVLNELKIKYEFEKRFDDCRDKKPLPFDFYIEGKFLVIELDGVQHFYSVFFFDGEDETNLEIRRYHDEIKNNYTRDKNIHLLRISFSEINNIREIIIQFLKDVDVSESRIERFVGKEYTSIVEQEFNDEIDELTTSTADIIV